jgi:hypothetical protein
MDHIYRVSFSKNLIDSTGHRAKPCQDAVEAHASCETDAIQMARRRFAELAGVNVWSLHADYETGEFSPTRKRISGCVWRRSRGSFSGPRKDARHNSRALYSGGALVSINSLAAPESIE